MKSWKKYWPACKPIAVVLGCIAAFLLLLIPVKFSEAGIGIGTFLLPVQVQGAVTAKVFAGSFSILLKVTTFVSLILFAAGGQKRFTRLIVFQFAALFVMLVPLMVKLAAFPSGRYPMLYIAYFFIFDAILKLLIWFFERETVAAIVMLCIQLASPFIIYLHDFRDFFPPLVGKTAEFLYLYLPVYHKIVGMLNNKGLQPILADLILAKLIVLVILIRYFMRKRQAKQAIPEKTD